MLSCSTWYRPITSHSLNGVRLQSLQSHSCALCPAAQLEKKQAAKRPIIVDRSIHTNGAPAAERADDVTETINPGQSASPVNLVSMESFLQADDDTIVPRADSLKPPSDVDSDSPENHLGHCRKLKGLALQNNPRC